MAQPSTTLSNQHELLLHPLLAHAHAAAVRQQGRGCVKHREGGEEQLVVRGEEWAWEAGGHEH